MKELIFFSVGFIFGNIGGIFMMCILQINNKDYYVKKINKVY